MTETRKSGLFGRLRERIASSTSGLRQELTGLAAYGAIDEEFWDLVEETLMGADLGPEIGLRLSADIRAEAERLKMRDSRQVVAGLRALLLNRMEWRPRGLATTGDPLVYLVVGVNGTGKTTTVAKIAARLQGEGRTALLGASDTFRAGAIEQLQLWADRLGSEFVSGQPGSDPASVAFAAVEAGRARGVGAVVVDTAGRLHTQPNLMEELKKIERTIGKAMPDAPHETLLTLDAAIGQNSIQQAKVFHETLRLTGLVVTKLDGSSRGGVILGLEEQFGIPVKLVGTGEQANDLELFEPRAYVDSLFEAQG
jgi:fused signal recognition particle receptor